MMDGSDSSAFYDTLPRLGRFAELARPQSYTPLPDDWVVGTADIEGSTQAIANGRYKTVNTVGAAVISAQINASGGRSFPFVFGGDGAAFACPPDIAQGAAQSLAAVQCWALEEFDLKLRTAMVPIADVRTAGRDVTVARFQASEGLDYAMFSGGGLAWVEAKMKSGELAVPKAAPGTFPDLTGLSCRWSNVRAVNGMILSVVIQPAEGTSEKSFSKVAAQVVAAADGLARGGHPLPDRGPPVSWPSPGLTIEAHVSRGQMALNRRRLQLLVENFISWFFFKTGLKAGEFDPEHYARTVSSNADYRKFDDGLKMTLDCDAATRQQIEEILTRARAKGLVNFGLFEQDEAMTTCFVPSINQDDHIHLIDGASGGYTQAAAQMKSELNRSRVP